MVLEIYCDPCSVNSRKVLAGLDLIGTEYHLNFISYAQSEQKSEAYRKINPHATIPSATDGGPTITESNAILMYAADRDGVDSAYPKDLTQRAQVNKWLLWESSVWFHSCYVFLFENLVKPAIGSTPDQTAIEAEMAKWEAYAKILDDQLAKSKWLASNEQPTIADIVVAAPMHLWQIQKLPLDKYPNLKRWMTEGIEQLPCWKKTQTAVNKAFGL